MLDMCGPSRLSRESRDSRASSASMCAGRGGGAGPGTLLAARQGAASMEPSIERLADSEATNTH